MLQMSSFQSGIPWILLIAAIFCIWYQNNRISRYQLQASRRKRDTLLLGSDDSTVFLPIYAQVSKTHILKVCAEHFKQSEKTVAVELKRKCPARVTFSQPMLIGARRNSEGCAYLDGARWHICEQSHGYTILSFKGDRRLNNASAPNPRAVKFLPYPFEGTDNTVYNNTMWYSEQDRLIAYQLRSQKTTIINLRASLEPLYPNSTSRIDVQAEEHGIWTLYRRREEKALTVSRFDAHSMQIVANWTLPSIHTGSMCNSFIRCAILYSMDCSGVVTPVYDFYSHTYIQGPKSKWAGLEQPIGNVQYDPNSRAVAIFANSKIYKVTVE